MCTILESDILLPNWFKETTVSLSHPLNLCHFSFSHWSVLFDASFTSVLDRSSVLVPVSVPGHFCIQTSLSTSGLCSLSWPYCVKFFPLFL